MAGGLTPLAVSVLALLHERAMHPYEMYQLLLERHDDEIVKVRPGSLYHTVERLSGLGHVRACGTERAGNRPERTTYEITSTGRAALRWRLLEMLSVPVNEYPQFPLAISQAHVLDRDQVVNQLRQRVQALDSWLDRCRELLDGVRARDLPEAYWVEADYLRTITSAERDWLATLIDRLEHRELAWPTDSP